MIIKIRYDAIKGDTAKIYSKGRLNTCLMNIIVTEHNLQDAIQKFGNNPTVVAFTYVGYDLATDYANIEKLAQGYYSKPILYKVDLQQTPVKWLNLAHLKEYLEGKPQNVRLIYKVPNEFSNMSAVWNLSRNNNVSFCGGDFIRIKGANIGCIWESDIQGRILNTLPITVCGRCCIMPTSDADDVSITFEMANKELTAQKVDMLKVAQEGSITKSETTTRYSTLTQLGGDTGTF